MIVVGVTGSLASGKSEVARIFKNHGALVFDADESARKEIQKGTFVYQAILKIFGKSFLGKNGQIDRKKLAEHVFAHPRDLKKLNILIHPGVIFDCIRATKQADHKKPFFVMDVPLLFESRMQGLADVTIVVSCGCEWMLRRAAKKGISQELARKILLSQWPLAKKERRADFVIENNGSLKDLEKKVEEVIKQINQGDKTKNGY